MIRIIVLMLLFLNLCCFGWDPYLPKGSLIKVYTKIPISTEHLEEGSLVYFISPSDVWVVEDRAIQKGDIFLGYVDTLRMPVQGVNAAMSIKIYELVKKEGSSIPIYGRVIFNNKDTLGGDLTNPASYNKAFHPRKVYGSHWGGTFQYVPSGEYEFGHHVGVSTRDSLFIQLDEDYYL